MAWVGGWPMHRGELHLAFQPREGDFAQDALAPHVAIVAGLQRTIAEFRQITDGRCQFHPAHQAAGIHVDPGGERIDRSWSAHGVPALRRDGRRDQVDQRVEIRHRCSARAPGIRRGAACGAAHLVQGVRAEPIVLDGVQRRQGRVSRTAAGLGLSDRRQHRIPRRRLRHRVGQRQGRGKLAGMQDVRESEPGHRPALGPTAARPPMPAPCHTAKTKTVMTSGMQATPRPAKSPVADGLTRNQS